VIPHAYPQIPVRTKLRVGFAVGPWVLLLVVVLGFLDDQGVIDLTPPSPPRPGPAVASGSGPPPSRAARADIPAGYLRLYQRAAKGCPGLPWGVLAAVGKVESNHGRGWPPRWANTPGIRRGHNGWGAAGPMQIGNGTGKAGNAWARFGRGGNVYDPAHAIPAAARYLCAAGAHGGRNLRGALYAYNHSPAYVRAVLAHAHRYQPPARGGGR
jgi:hypothetical protein